MKITGIAIVGLNGSGKSTLAHALAKATGYYEMDVEDYYFPEQKEHRFLALENQPCPALPAPFADSRSREQAEAAMLADIRLHPAFLLAGVHLHWSEEILSRLRLVVWVRTPPEIRLQRIRDREIRRFGDRVLPGGDMYESQCAFHRMASSRREDVVAESIRARGCPVVELDGMADLAENVQKVQQLLLTGE